MPAQPDREALIEETLQKMRENLEKNLPADDAPLEQIEDAVEEIGSDVLGDLQQRLTNQRSRKPRENRVACPCGRQARYRCLQKRTLITRHGLQRTLITRHGLLQWRRPYYRCDACGFGYAPLDETLGLDGADTSLQVREWMAHLSAQLGFEQANDTLRRLRGIDVSVTTVERVSVRAGTSLRQAQLREAALHQQDNLPDRRRPCPRRLYVGADGVMSPLREPWKKDGSLGTLQCHFGECKSGVVYETYQDKEGRDQRVKSRAYCATLGPLETFEPMLGTLAHECGHHGAQEVVAIGDGAPWIWNMFGRQFPERSRSWTSSMPASIWAR